MRLYSFLWIVPFLGAALGYVACMHILPPKTHRMPNLVGLPVTKALTIASAINTNMRIRKTVVDSLVAQDSVIAQLPDAGSTIKEQQSIFVTIACKKDFIPMPSMTGLPITECKTILDTLEIPFEIHFVPSDYPRDTCCAQLPAAQSIINPANTKAHLYAPTQQKSSILWPDLRGYRLQDVIDFLHEYTMTINIHSIDDQTHENKAVVIAHKPSAGSIVAINPEKTLSVELYVGNKDSQH